jgi:hypothetical protein
VGNVEAYKKEDAICPILPIFYIFVVQLLSTGGIQIENASRSVTVSGVVRSGADGIIGLRRHDGNVGIAGWERWEHPGHCGRGFIQCAKRSTLELL